jgi:hypothetical protein
VIASQPGAQSIPALSFSYFDPETRRYETARSSPLSVKVSPSSAASVSNEPPPVASAAGTAADEAHSGLRPDHPLSETRVDTLIPPNFQPRFLAVPSVLALLFGGGWIALRRRERNANDVHKKRERARSQMTHAALEQMAAAAAARDAAAFFNSARSVLQQALGARGQVPPEHITGDDVDMRLESDGDKDDVRQIFALADEANYSGDDPRVTDFARWTEVVQRQLAIEKSS